MPNLNLTTEDNIEEKPSIFGRGLIVSIIILVLLLCIYGILLYFNKSTSRQLQTVSGEYDVEYNKLKEGKGNEVLDFKNRSDIAQQKLGESQSMGDMLAQIESSILPNVYLNSLKYDKTKKTITLDCVGDNFKTVARQILSFKDNKSFLSVVPGQSSLDTQKNVINFSIDLKIK